MPQQCAVRRGVTIIAATLSILHMRDPHRITRNARQRSQLIGASWSVDGTQNLPNEVLHKPIHSKQAVVGVEQNLGLDAGQ